MRSKITILNTNPVLTPLLPSNTHLTITQKIHKLPTHDDDDNNHNTAQNTARQQCSSNLL